jgi:hypothetical protein
MRQDILSRCLAAIEPAETELKECREDLVGVLNYLADYVRKNPSYDYLESSRKLQALSKAFREAGTLMQSAPGLFILGLPILSYVELLSTGAETTSEEEEITAQRQWSATSSYLLSMAEAADGVLKARPINELKRHCATLAFHLLVKFGEFPRLTIDGPFYVLAATLYEVATGRRNANLERACRAVSNEVRRDLRAVRADDRSAGY